MLFYFLTILCPPLGMLLHGKFLQAGIGAVIWGYALMTPGVIGLLLWSVAGAHGAYVIRNARRIRTLDSSL